MANHRSSVRHLKLADPVLAGVIETVGACRLQLRTEGTHFEALARAIVFQQLSGKAASTIYGRLSAQFADGTPTPDAVLTAAEDTLRAAGLSRQKTAYLRDLSLKVTGG